VRDAIALLDVGSTYTKAALVDVHGHLVGSAKVPTDLEDIGRGMQRAVAEALERLPLEVIETLACSSAGGGLRVAVLGLEERLTLESARRAAATAGARIVFAGSGILDDQALDQLVAAAPDLILLTGGTNGGDRRAIVENAARLRELVSEVAVVVAGNEEAHADVRRALDTASLVCFARNVLPEIGRLDVEDAQRQIREIFIEHVIGRRRLVSRRRIVHTIRMPTPRAVLEATRALAAVGRRFSQLVRPVVVDVGGATTDVHSALPADSHDRAYGADPVPQPLVARTVEGDLGVRENAHSLLEEASRGRYLGEQDVERLRPAVGVRHRHRTHVAADADEASIDDELARIASAIALSRHAGSLRITLSDDGATLRRTGRDLRRASCIVATGGVFQHSDHAGSVVSAALRLARDRGALVPPGVPVFIDRSYVLAAAGLLSSVRPSLARRLLVNELASSAVTTRA
jgi:uncharacterized protein (TIGR01319 family)